MRRVFYLSLTAISLWGQSAVLISRKAPADVELTADPSSAFWREAKNIVTDTARVHQESGAEIIRHWLCRRCQRRSYVGEIRSSDRSANRSRVCASQRWAALCGAAHVRVQAGEPRL